jgi:hypothetical protein
MEKADRCWLRVAAIAGVIGALIAIVGWFHR